jgi:hypothetical protein
MILTISSIISLKHIIPHPKQPGKTRVYFLHGTNAHKIEFTLILGQLTKSDLLHY